MRLQPGERRTVTVVGVALLLLLAFAALRPLLNRAPGDAAGEDLQKRVDQAERTLADEASIRARHDDLAGESAAAERMFPPDVTLESAQVSLLSLVEEIAAGAGFTLDAKGPFTLGDGTLPALAVSVTGTGDAAAVMRFVHDLGTAEYRLDLERLEISAGENRRLQARAVVATLLPRLKEEADNARGQ